MASENNKRIAKNTVALYVQTLMGMLIGLYTSRVMLNIMGIADFGLYNVIGGVVVLFGVLQSAMASSTSRFITFELAGGDRRRLKEVFSTGLLIHLGIALAVAVMALTIGPWFMETYMQIPAARLEAAQWVFYCAVISTFIAIVNVPYGAAIVAHERMSIFAYFSVLDLVLKLGVVFLLQFVDTDKLIVYAAMLVGVQVLMQTIYFWYCFRQFEEVRVGFVWNKRLFKEMTSFAGWSLFGDSAVMMMTQGTNILLNIFFGAPLNAARGIAVQVQGALARFVGGFQTALNPQITKSYATKDLQYMHKLIFASSKFSFVMMLLLAIPVFIEAEHILTWWLKVVPPHTVNFVRIMLLISLIDCLANPLIFAAKATGRIKVYQSILGSLLLLVVPVSYLILKLGFPPESIFVVHLAIAFAGQIVRVWLIKPMIKLSLADYWIKVLFSCMLLLGLSPILPFTLYNLLDESLFRLVVIISSSCLSILLLGYVLALDKLERLFLENFVKSRFKRQLRIFG